MTRANVTQRLALAVQAAAKHNPALANRPISPGKTLGILLAGLPPPENLMRRIIQRAAVQFE